MEIGIGDDKEVKVPLFNEQALNVDQAVFGDPTELETDPNEQRKATDTFKPRQMHAWLAKCSGANRYSTAIEEDPHTADNSGIPTFKLKNASLNEMLKRMTL